mmetsp:Transcript_122020/g.340191  ORF Transcript_122020/g.340191 Transcript_122020/m.340191 type:complete len:209 (+) Transcript_122020:397-1023(+)
MHEDREALSSEGRDSVRGSQGRGRLPGNCEVDGASWGLGGQVLGRRGLQHEAEGRAVCGGHRPPADLGGRGAACRGRSAEGQGQGKGGKGWRQGRLGLGLGLAALRSRPASPASGGGAHDRRGAGVEGALWMGEDGRARRPRRSLSPGWQDLREQAGLAGGHHRACRGCPGPVLLVRRQQRPGRRASHHRVSGTCSAEARRCIPQLPF